MSRCHRALGRLAAALCLAVLPTACMLEMPTPQAVVLRFALSEDDAPYYEPIVLDFQKEHPGVTVELLGRREDGLSALGPGDMDVLLWADTMARQERGELLNLDPWLAQDDTFDRADFYPGTLELYMREGKTWAVPVSLDPVLMYYNRDLFDARKVPYPRPGWSWNEFLDTAMGLTDSETGVYGYVFEPSGSDCYWFIYQHGGKLFDDIRNPTRPTFDDPLTVDAMDWCADLIHVHHVAPTQDEALAAFGGHVHYAIYQGIMGGKVGMWTGALTSRGGLQWREPWPFRYGLTTLPRDAQAATWVNVEALSISSQTEHRDLSWQLVSFLSRQMPGRAMPARRSLAESDKFEQLVGTGVASVARAAVEDSIMVDLSAQPASLSRAFEALNTAIGEILSGEAAPKDALVGAQRQAEEASAGP